MLREIKEYGKYVEITGFKKLHVAEIDRFLDLIAEQISSDVEIQFFDAESIATWRHLYFAVLDALMMFQNNKNISRSVAMESMLYASTQDQIKTATETIGITPNTKNIAVMVIADSAELVVKTLRSVSKMLKVKPDDSVLELSKHKERVIRRRLGISKAELETVDRNRGAESAIVDLVIERMALLAGHG
jgi:tRNA threonylcarbamoyladenosine modification (KEOPS) complex Cgi121 subunit